jgi:HK97 family phage major capsid protein
MTVYNSLITRAGSGSDALVPEPLSNQIFQELPKASAALSLMTHMPLSAKTQRLPVLDVLPTAYFVSGDTGMKQTAAQAWKNVNLVVEELAVIVPVPESYASDADVDIWSQVRPRMVEALGAVIDAAVFWGTAKPSTWGTAIYPGAITAGNYISDGFLDAGASPSQAAADFGQSVASLGDFMSQTGYTVRGFAGRPGLNWRLAGLRSIQGAPIYQADMSSDVPGNGQLYGFPIFMPENGSWNTSNAQLIAGDWTKAVVGIRQDISWKLFTEGVISDDSGNVVLNLMQQDSIALRMTMRMAYATANPVTVMQPTLSIDGSGTALRWPFGVIKS